MRKFLAGCLLVGAMGPWGLTAQGAEPVVEAMSMTDDVGAAVVQAKVKGDVLTVVLRYENVVEATVELSYPVAEVYYIDPADQKKYHVLKDSSGKWIAAPVNNYGKVGNVGFTSPLKMKPGAKQVVWFKFPAPGPESASIDLSVPGLLPLDGLPISR